MPQAVCPHSEMERKLIGRGDPNLCEAVTTRMHAQHRPIPVLRNRNRIEAPFAGVTYRTRQFRHVDAKPCARCADLRHHATGNVYDKYRTVRSEPDRYGIGNNRISQIRSLVSRRQTKRQPKDDFGRRAQPQHQRVCNRGLTCFLCAISYPRALCALLMPMPAAKGFRPTNAK